MASNCTNISRSNLANLASLDGEITKLRHLASYDWLEKPAPTILVPGCPPLWSPPSVPSKLTPDSGTTYYIDQDASRNPRSPLEPLFRALYAGKPSFNIGDIDLVTDRNSIHKLLCFVQATSNDPFTIGVEIVGDKTALFTCVEKKTTEVIEGFQGYGHNFEKRSTERSEGVTGHHRIVGYEFGGLSCIVRHETDGIAERTPRQRPWPLHPLSQLLSKRAASRWTYPQFSRSGLARPTVSWTWWTFFPQLWISQTPWLAVGYHRHGLFDNVRVENITESIRGWETAHQEDLGKLASLLAKIIGTVKSVPSQTAHVEFDGGSSLKIVEADGTRALPGDLYTQWAPKSNDDDNQAQPSASGRPRTEQVSPRPLVPYGTALSEIISLAVYGGPRYFFLWTPAELSGYRELCTTVKSLPVNVLGGRGMRNIMRGLRGGRRGWNQGGRRLARDSAFRLLYLMLLAQGLDQNAVYNAVLYVVSHRSVFGSRTRHLLRAAFEDRFRVTVKQKKGLDEWLIEREKDEGGDVASEEEEELDSDYYYGSDLYW